MGALIDRWMGAHHLRWVCNLYRLDPSQKVFDFTDEQRRQFNVQTEVFPNFPGVVIESNRARVMNWGFPVRNSGAKPGTKPHPVNNARDDKILVSNLWRHSFAKRRCLIPLSQWAEPQGVKGSKTRTWLGLPGLDAFAVAGIWRYTDEWGDCFSMVMTSANDQVCTVHDRMPVILAPGDYAQWTSGTPDEAFALVRPWAGPLAIDATEELWSAKPPAPTE